MLAQVGSGNPLWFDLHADSIALRRDGPGEGVAAKERLVARRVKTHDHVLTGHRRWQRLTVRALHRQREDIRGLLLDRRHQQRTKSRCRGMRRNLGYEPGITGGAAVQ